MGGDLIVYGTPALAAPLTASSCPAARYPSLSRASHCLLIPTLEVALGNRLMGFAQGPDRRGRGRGGARAYPLVSELVALPPDLPNDSRSGFAGPNEARSAWKKPMDKNKDASIVTHKNEPNLSKNVSVHSESTADARKVVTAAAVTEMPIV